MAIQEYNKIVRRKTPGIIEQNGAKPDYKIMRSDDKEMTKRFHEKIHEEMNELLAAKSSDEIIEEASDLIQIVSDYVQLHGHSEENLETVRKAKNIKRGTFLYKNREGGDSVVYLVKVQRPEK